MNEKRSLSIIEIEQSICVIRGQRVILDSTLSKIYGVTVKRLNEQVRRNADRFPSDFMFTLTYQEVAILRSQFATLKKTGSGTHRKYLPSAFTEHGAIMLANVLHSPTAVQASIQVVRAFVRLKEMVATHQNLLRKINAMEKQYDAQFKIVFDAVRSLMSSPVKPTRTIGFKLGDKSKNV